ncbi:RNA polymerase I associated factor, A49-like protein [Pluteus cervinus]|uniref:RNA polymerase I associated factor, A49-like protein n=1 Tax=Pluteus cervinus TaxID=181527 RepID=A0ACD3B3X8_9AGAR|nr:RNA polymerase I associated factor, A49-like protein [Pluteus cervinus]
MAPDKKSSKKRKREVSPEPGLKISIASPAPKSGEVGVALAAFPAVEVPDDTAFRCYVKKKSKTDESQKTAQDVLVVGETDSIEFVSNEEETRKAAEGGCRYVIALHNPKTSTLTIHPTISTPYIFTQTVKALKSIPPASAPTATQWREARNALGETFGTKKAKASIRAQERNRIDVGAMEGVMDFVTESIDKNAVGLMTQEEAKVLADETRLIPAFNATTSDPTEVYPISSVIPDVEWKAISVSAFDQASTYEERKALLPFAYSRWCQSHLRRLYSGEQQKANKKELKIIFYVAAMLGFRDFIVRKKSIDRTEIKEKLSQIPEMIVDSLLSRFTEVPRESTHHRRTPAKDTFLLTHIFALFLRLDNYACDPEALSLELKMTVADINRHFKSLGCKVIPVTERDRTRLGLPESALKTKRAMLEAPVQFPKARTGKRRA